MVLIVHPCLCKIIPAMHTRCLNELRREEERKCKDVRVNQCQREHYGHHIGEEMLDWMAILG